MAADFIAGRIAVENKTCFNPAPATDEFGSIAGELGSKGSGAAGVASTVPAAWSGACDNLSTTLSVTQSQVKVIELDAKSQGREPTDEELDEACGPLSFLTKLPGLLDEALSDIFGKFNEFATSFGETVGQFMAKFDKLVADVLGAVDEVAQAIAQAALDAFELVNKVALEAIEAIESVVNTVATAINDAINFATDAFNKAIDKLLAFADSINFASIFGLDCQTEALENAVDTDKIADADEIDRVIAPRVVVSTDETITSETLSKEPFNLSAAGAPGASPELEELIDRYRTDARALKSANDDIATANAEGRAPPFTRTQLNDLERKRDSSLQNLRVAALADGKNISTLPIYGRNYDSPIPAAGTTTRAQNASTARPTVGDDYEKAESREAKIQKLIQDLKNQVAEFNRINEATFAIIRTSRTSREPITRDVAEAINRAIRQNEEVRAGILRNLNSLPPDIGPRVRREVGLLEPVLR